MTRTFHSLVLCYHAISDTWSDELAVSQADFERQLRRLLDRSYRPVPAVEALDGRRKILHVTFDDAFRSVAKALPILERLGVPATVFACPDYADDGRPLAVPELAPEARHHPDELTTMNWDDLRALVERQIVVASHTLTHPHLTTLSEEELRRELRGARERLQDELRVPCRFLAYPYGEEDERVRAAARASGYDAAFALPGKQTPIDRYAIPRVGIWRSDGVVRTALKTSPIGRRVVSGPANAVRARWPRLARTRGAERPVADDA
jgi:peptidoglycan/xylan/chitin deacetylase (PgdA/CDA1 family)